MQLNPEDAEANYSMGMVFARLDDAEGAYEYLRRALVIRPDYPEALNNLRDPLLAHRATERGDFQFQGMHSRGA